MYRRTIPPMILQNVKEVTRHLVKLANFKLFKTNVYKEYFFKRFSRLKRGLFFSKYFI